MSHDNKLNMQYFEATSMHELYNTMHEWQEQNQTRLLSLSVQKDGESFCCIALTNPTEVVITSADGKYHAIVSEKGNLFVL